MSPSPDDTAAFEAYGRMVNPSYPQFLRRLGIDRVAVRAEGAVITDSGGRSFLDCIAGYGVCNLGHNPPRIVDALVEALRGRPQMTRPFIVDAQVEFAEALRSVAPGDLSCSFALNSGSEAIDCAIKLARLTTRRKEIVTAAGSFHGHTFGALSASGIPAFKRAFEPVVPGFVPVPYGDVASLAEAVTDDTAAVLIEPVQHEAGVIVPPDEYLSEVRGLCDERGLLLVLDEIKTGIGKTGRTFACEHASVVPDILVLGKSLGAGLVPIGAVLARPRLWRAFGLSFPMSASSYAGNVLACRAGSETIRSLDEDLLKSCARKGRYVLDGLRTAASRYPDFVKGAAGRGMLMGVEFTEGKYARDTAKAMIERGVLVFTAFANGSVLMVEPPIVITDEQAERIVHTFTDACATLCE